MHVPSQVFREYDIRGIVGDDLTPDLVEAVGAAYAERLHSERGAALPPPRVALGWDNRPSSDALRNALARGLSRSGVEVLELGTVPTPVSWWAEPTLGVEGALQVTGSHNPAEWNGIKMTLLGRSLYGEDIQALRRWVEAAEWPDRPVALRLDTPVLDRYVEDLSSRFRLARPVRVVVDCGNGTGSVVAERLLSAVGAEVIPLYCDSDGTFPNHHPDPTVDENLADLIDQVRMHGAEVGIAFDGDADRIGVVDETGAVIRGDILVLLFGLDILAKRGPGALLLFDVKCSQVLPEIYTEAGGEAMMWKTGHSLMKEKMKETGALLSGELSGHICFADEYLGFDDALYAALRLLDQLSRNPEPLSRQVARFPQFVSTPEIRIDVPEERKLDIVRKAVEEFGARYRVIEVDGARILFPGGWGLLRASNTQPVLVARYEARTPEELEQIRKEIEGWLRTQGIDG